MASKAARPLKVQPLWARVDQNRVKLASFVALFVIGSATLITAALVLLPGTLIGAFGAQFAEWWSPEASARALWIIVPSSLALLVALGGLLAAVQISNAEDWVRSRLNGRELAPAEATSLASAAADMSLAAGLGAAPRLMLVDADPASVNAFALGTSRSRPLIGITRGFLEQLTEDEQRAVVATLTARIITGDIWFATALAALMGPLKAIREARLSGESASAIADGCGHGCSGADLGGCGDGCSGLDLDDSGCGGVIAVIVFFVLVAVLTYAAVVCAAWIVTLWGRALHRTAYEKADAEGMLLLKDPKPMLSALRKVSERSTSIGSSDASYDGIFYAATSGTPRVERVEARRYARLREVLGTEGVAAEPLEAVE